MNMWGHFISLFLLLTWSLVSLFLTLMTGALLFKEKKESSTFNNNGMRYDCHAIHNIPLILSQIKEL